MKSVLYDDIYVGYYQNYFKFIFRSNHRYFCHQLSVLAHIQVYIYIK